MIEWQSAEEPDHEHHDHHNAEDPAGPLPAVTAETKEDAAPDEQGHHDDNENCSHGESSTEAVSAKDIQSHNSNLASETIYRPRPDRSPRPPAPIGPAPAAISCRFS